MRNTTGPGRPMKQQFDILHERHLALKIDIGTLTIVPAKASPWLGAKDRGFGAQARVSEATIYC
jgi:hypothetical protein